MQNTLCLSLPTCLCQHICQHCNKYLKHPSPYPVFKHLPEPENGLPLCFCKSNKKGNTDSIAAQDQDKWLKKIPNKQCQTCTSPILCTARYKNILHNYLLCLLPKHNSIVPSAMQHKYQAALQVSFLYAVHPPEQGSMQHIQARSNPVNNRSHTYVGIQIIF
jgi:hypothetical protein